MWNITKKSPIVIEKFTKHPEADIDGKTSMKET